MFEEWDETDPVDDWECRRARKILERQKNENPFVRNVPVQGETPEFVHGSWTLIVIPDTQRYTDLRSDPSQKILGETIKWIADNKESRNIKFVLQEGDITGGNSNNTLSPSGNNWKVASDAFTILEIAGIPYSLALGNHDYDINETTPKGASSREATHLNEFFPVSRYAAMSTFGGVFEEGKTENHFHLFSVGGKEYIVMTLELAPRDETLAWSNKILKQYSNHTALVNTHIYTYSDGSRYDWAAKGDSQVSNPHNKSYGISAPHDGTENLNDGQEMWDKFVSKHANVSMVFSGHVYWAGARQMAVGNLGNIVHEMVAAYHEPFAGDTDIMTDYIRLLEFQPDEKTVQVKTYSPRFNQYMTDGENQFVITLNGKYDPSLKPGTILSSTGFKCPGYPFLTNLK
jgi:hypothetical protein